MYSESALADSLGPEAVFPNRAGLAVIIVVSMLWRDFTTVLLVALAKYAPKESFCQVLLLAVRGACRQGCEYVVTFSEVLVGLDAHS